MSRIGFRASVALLALTAATSASEAQQAGVTFDGSALIMKRQQADVPIVSFQSNPAAGGVYRSKDFSDGWSAGLEAGAHLRYGAFGLMIRGMKLSEESSQSASFRGAAGFLAINTAPATFYGAAGATLRGDYKSDTSSFELDVSYNAFPGLTVFAGPRWIRVGESLALTGSVTTTGVPFEVDSWNVGNRLFGGQLGAQAELMRLLAPGYAGPFDVTAKVAGGWAHNSIDSAFSVGLPVAISRHAEVTGGASSKFVEAGAELSYAILPSVSLSAGYKMLWISDVATALHQVGATGNFGGGPQRLGIGTTDVLYHGATGRVTLKLN